MAAETDSYIIASSALWAGDFEYFEKLLRAYSNPSDVEPIDQGAEVPEDFIRATGALRLRQLWQKRGEFKKLAREYARQGAEITDRGCKSVSVNCLCLPAPPSLWGEAQRRRA